MLSAPNAQTAPTSGQHNSRGDPKSSSEVIKLAVGQFSIATALAFYFGWARATAYWAYFGLNASMVGLSSTNYLLGSTGALYWPAMALGFVALIAVNVHPRIIALLRPARAGVWLLLTLRAVAWATLILATGIFIAATYWHTSWGKAAIPWLIAGGTLLLAYGWLLDDRPGVSRSRRVAQLIILSGLAFGAFFWLVGNFAGYSGNAQAREDAEKIAYRTDVAIYSAQQLALGGRVGIVEDVSNEGAYHYRYTNLRLLAYADGRYFLLPTEWRRNGRDPVVVISESDSVRVELIGPPYG